MAYMERSIALPAAGKKALDLPRVLGPFSAASILIGSIIGSGVFRKPSIIADDLPSPGWILSCWCAAGFLSLIGSLVFAEMGSYFPGAGGQYTYLRESFGKFLGFLFGWTNLLIINSASIAALVVFSAEHLFNLLPASLQPAEGSHWFQTVPVLMVVLLTAINAVGVKWGAAVQNTLTVLKLAAIGLIIFGIFLPGKPHGPNLSPFWSFRGDTSFDAIWAGFKGAFIAIFWAYDGWYLLSFSGAEIRNPRRNIPIGFIMGILVVIGVYVAANVSYFCVIDVEEMKTIKTQGGVAAEVAGRLYGPIGISLIAVGLVGSTLGAANGNLLTGPRLSYAMARDGLFFRPFASVHARFLTPLFAIIVQGIIGAAYVYAGTFDQLTDSVVFAAWVFYLLTVAGYFVLRRRFRARDDVFRAPGHPVLPIIFIAFAAVFLVYAFMDSASSVGRYIENPSDPRAANGIYPVICVILIFLGIPVYWLLRRLASRRRKQPLEEG
jgi:APA family basic amino acid/polyamine antiporter